MRIIETDFRTYKTKELNKNKGMCFYCFQRPAYGKVGYRKDVDYVCVLCLDNYPKIKFKCHLCDAGKYKQDMEMVKTCIQCYSNGAQPIGSSDGLK